MVSCKYNWFVCNDRNFFVAHPKVQIWYTRTNNQTRDLATKAKFFAATVTARGGG